MDIIGNGRNQQFLVTKCVAEIPKERSLQSETYFGEVLDIYSQEGEEQDVASDTIVVLS
jgi:hypothetical protein